MHYREKFNARQKEENERRYKQYLSCGYTGSMTVNEYGWCDNEVDRNNVEKINVFRKNRIYAYIDVIQLPNGKWVAGSNLTMPTYGYGHGVSIWCNQFTSRQEAIEAHLKQIENYIEVKDLTGFVRNAIEACRKALQQPIEITLF